MNDQGNGDNEPDGVDKSVVKLTKAEKRTKIKRMRKEAKKQSKEVAEVEEVEETPQTAVLVLILMQPIASYTYFGILVVCAHARTHRGRDGGSALKHTFHQI